MTYGLEVRCSIQLSYRGNTHFQINPVAKLEAACPPNRREGEELPGNIRKKLRGEVTVQRRMNSAEKG